MSEKLILWEPAESEIIPSAATTATQITKCAVQLSLKDQRQIARALEARDFEIGVNYLWVKAMAALKRELGTLGIEFLGEMLGRPDVNENDDVHDLLTDKDALRLAEELGMISTIEALRLRQTQELIAHFAKSEFNEVGTNSGEMDDAEAFRALRACIKNILGKPRIEVAHRFVEFRDALLTQPVSEHDTSVALLTNSPYFFRKLSVSILLSAIKTATGAALEIALGNLNTVLPILWDKVRETEKWQVGRTYAEVYAAGMTSATQGLKQALLKVRGFDFVPENLRSDTFVKAAEAIIKAHEGIDNFYTELSPVKNLERLGTVIPAPALSSCASALLAVALGNMYGASFTAAPVAKQLLAKFTKDRWEYYLNQCLPGDIRILNKLESTGPTRRWKELVRLRQLDSCAIKNAAVRRLIEASVANDDAALAKAQARLTQDYYGKRPSRT
jgi:hypothetical protein